MLRVRMLQWQREHSKCYQIHQVLCCEEQMHSKGRLHGTMKITTALDEWSFAGGERGSMVTTPFLCQQWRCRSKCTHPPSTAKAGGRGWTKQPSETQQGMLTSPSVLMDHPGDSAQLGTHCRGAVTCPPLPDLCPQLSRDRSQHRAGNVRDAVLAEWKWDQGFRDSGALTRVEKILQTVAGAWQRLLVLHQALLPPQGLFSMVTSRSWDNPSK